jgi:opacity protein-like surface antigen
MRKITKAILTVTILATPLAADPVRGLFASLNLGLRFTPQNHDYTNPNGAVGKETKLNTSTSFGLSLGMLNQMEKSKVVVGGEVSVAMNQSKGNYSLHVDGAGTEGKVSITNPYTLGVYGIAGMMMTPKLMFYAKAGYAWMTNQLKYTDLDRGENPSSRTYKKTMGGLSGGGGLNFLVTNKFMVGGEYLYHAPKEITPRKNDSPEGGQRRKFVYHPSVHTVSLKLSMLF